MSQNLSQNLLLIEELELIIAPDAASWPIVP